MKLQEIRSGLNLSGFEPTEIVNVVATVPQGERALQLIYHSPNGVRIQQLMLAANQQSIDLATAERPFSFDDNGIVEQEQV